jgi:CheY-like chemotaxis protein
MQIRTILEEQDYAVQVAPNGAEALTNLQWMRPGCIILDLMMPEIDGFEVLKQIRALPQIAATPVLVLTAKELTHDDRAQLANNHIQQLVQKGSLNREELGACVRRLLMPPAAVQSQVSHHAGDSILVVENDPDNLLVITAVLDEAGYNYVTATDGNQAVVLARQTPPALILMDVQLPGADGLEVARQIKADPRLAETPIVGLTAMAMRGQREEILAAGVDDYLAKPFKPQDLIHMVRRWLG